MAEEVKTIEELQAEINRLNDLNAKLKGSFDSAAKDASKWKHQYEDTNAQLVARMTEQERADVERAKTEKEKDDLIASLQREKTVAKHRAEFLSMGYDADLADKTAVAMVDGDFATMFANQKAFNEAQKKAFEAQSLNHQPTLSKGSPVSKDIIDSEEQARLRKYFGL